jgi:PAS domain S-box-containing protein
MITLRFLLLEDNPTDADAIRSTLIEGGIDAELLRIETRTSFIAALETDRVDLILTNDALPDLDGFAVLETVDCLRSKIPVVFVSDRIGEERVIDALERGAAGYVLKRRLNRLAATLDRVLHNATKFSDRQTYEHFLAIGSDFQVITNRNGYFKWVSPSVERMLGWTVTEMLSRPWTEFVHPDDIATSIAEADSLFSGDETYRFENRYRHKNGSYRWLLWNAQSCAKNHVLYGAATDVTERKQAKEALSYSENRLHRLATASPSVIYTIIQSPDKPDRFEYVSSAVEGIHEVSVAAALENAERVLNQIYPDDRAAYQQSVARSLETLQPFQHEWRIVTPSGKFKWLQANSQPQHQGNEIVWHGIVQEVTDRKQAEISLQQQSLILENMKDGAMMADQNGTIVFTNPAFDQMYGYSRGELLQRSVYLLTDYATEENQQFMRSVFQQLITHGSYEGQVNNRKKDGSPFVSEIQVKTLRSNGNLCLIAVQRDISDRVRLQAERDRILEREQAARTEAERANRIKDEFLAVLSHELRSPLNPILGWTNLLQAGRLDPIRAKEAIATIKRNAELQSQLIEDLLDVSRILRGKLVLTVTPVNLTTTVQSAIETVRLAAEAKQIQIQTHFDANVGVVSGDAGRLQQVVWNLLSNAVKFTPKGRQVEIGVSVIEQLARIEVSDTGKGISPEFLPYVFEHFRQEDGSTTRRFGGLGLGLAIVRQIVELHGGTVCADSAGEDQGATFTVTLPMLNAAPPPVATEAPLTDTEHALVGIHALVVDDEADTRDFHAFVLQQNGATVTVANSALTALQQFDRAIPDILISDVGMPEMDGYQLIQTIRSRAPNQGGAIPAIALTAYAGEIDQRKAIASGFQHHLAKPIDVDALIQMIVQSVKR